METGGLEGAKQRLTDFDHSSGATRHEFHTEHLSRQSSGKDHFVPVDKANAVYFTFLLYGIGVLLPFNVIMACLDFYF